MSINVDLESQALGRFSIGYGLVRELLLRALAGALTGL
jgi:hypothetical protein